MAENYRNKNEKIVVIGGSAGSLHVILSLLGSLNETITVPIVIIIHRKNDSESNLDNLMDMRSKVQVKEAEDKELIKPGIVYLAAANYHLLIEDTHRFALDSSEKINFSRPSIDVTFESAAETYGKGVTGILLSGANADGVEGLRSIQQRGGRIIAQDPATAQVAFMPQSAIDQLQVDAIITEDEIAGLINSL